MLIGDEVVVVQQKLRPEVLIGASLPSLVGNFTPDVYNALVNINQVIMNEGPEEYLRQLKFEKD
jgi:hypothetical protein